MSARFEGEHVVVVGAGVAGVATAEVLVAQGARVTVSEERTDDMLGEASARLRELGVHLRAGGHEPGHLEDATLVVTGPGVAERAPILGWARSRGLPVWGEMELGARLCDAPYVGVTGTNGKTTTTGMIAACLRAGGLDAVACGNIGRPFPTTAVEVHDVLVVECSSFQLQMQTSFHPKVSVLLNLAPDHLDWHGSFAAYVAAKAKIFARQGRGDVHVGNRDDTEAARVSSRAPCAIEWTRTGPPAPGEFGYDGDELIRADDPAMRFGSIDASRPGYRADAAAAAAASIAFGVTDEAVRNGLASFTPPRHRGEVVAEMGGVRFIDNSKATNVHAALAAIDGVDDAVLIAGGDAKGVDLLPLRTRAGRLRGVVAIGRAAPELLRVFEGLLPIEIAPTIEDAVATAAFMALPTGVVLLAPACASWDQFSGYGERGERFKAAARALEAS
ncbi:MAG: UDP-N-acetylmuramoyl-L-alanine--D-glutamate ligase [Actinomycetota bacterium]